MTKHFLFLEIRDSEICTLLHQLRYCFNKKPSKSNIHITVRGPYKNELKLDDTERFQKIMEGDTIRIGDVGRFDNSDTSVVFLRIASQHLGKIWWKPDYPKRKYGFNPHISLYSGKDKILADHIFDFLKSESLYLDTRQFELTKYVSNQFCLISEGRQKFEKHFLRLILNKKVKGDILTRAQAVVDSHHQFTRLSVG